MSWYLNESNIKLNIAKRKIIASLLLNNYELVSICFCKLYTAGAVSKTWLYSGLEGGLTLVIDYRRKTARFILFDLHTLEIVFENEFYRKFNIFYTSLSESFQCFEVAGGFVGFNIPDKYDADKFFKAVTGLTDQTIARRAKDIKITNILDIKNSAKKMLNILQEKLNEEYFFKESLAYESTLDFDFHHLEKVFESIEYDSKAKTFSITGNDKEIKSIVAKIHGIKIKDEKDQRIADHKAYIAELYRNFQATDKLIKKTEAAKLLEEQQSKLQSEKSERIAAINNTSTKKPEPKKEEKDVKPQSKKEELSTAEKIKNQKVTPFQTNTKIIPKAPPIPAIPPIPGAQNIPKPSATHSSHNIPKAPPIPNIPKPPSIPNIPKPPGIPGIPPIPGNSSDKPAIPRPNANLLSAIRQTGENKAVILKKPPMINDRSAPRLNDIQIDQSLKESINKANLNVNNMSSINNTLNVTTFDSNNITKPEISETKEEIEIEQPEKKQTPVKKPPPMDMMSELRMRMENRVKKTENTAANPTDSTTSTNTSSNYNVQPVENTKNNNPLKSSLKPSNAIPPVKLNPPVAPAIAKSLNNNFINLNANYTSPTINESLNDKIKLDDHKENDEMAKNEEPINIAKSATNIQNHGIPIPQNNNHQDSANKPTSGAKPGFASLLAQMNQKFGKPTPVANNAASASTAAPKKSNINFEALANTAAANMSGKGSAVPSVPKAPSSIPPVPGFVPPPIPPPSVNLPPGAKAANSNSKGIPKPPPIAPPSIPKPPPIPSPFTAPTSIPPSIQAPKIPAPPQPPKIINVENTTPSLSKDDILSKSNQGLLGQIRLGGIQLKKTETVEKTGLDSLRKKESIAKSNINTTSTSSTSGGKSDLFAEIRKAAMKKMGGN